MKILSPIVTGLQAISSFAAPLFVIAIVVLFFTKVDLEPQITSDFFFSSDSEIYEQNQAIKREFPFQKQIIMSVSTPNITDPAYIDKIASLTSRLERVKGVKAVQSITNGPDDLDAARNNPLWKRLLIGEKEKSSSIIVMVSTDDFKSLVKNIESIIEKERTDTYKVRISGLPYIVEQIRRNLTRDMKTLFLGAVGLSTLMLFLVFRSPLVVFGAFITCVSAAMLTLVIQSFLGVPIGILTANLGIIVYVLTLSHIIFLVSNWCNAAKKNKDAKLKETLLNTLPASFWAAVTTLLGFASLIFVQAKPLNELGMGGVIGTISAIICAYTVLPAFLRLANVNPAKFTYTLARKFPLSKGIALKLSVVMIVAAFVVGGFGIMRVDTDPSLLSYFKEDTKLYDGIYYVDKNGGSNPLLLVVKRKDGGKLDNRAAYEQMWELQNTLSKHKSVGSIISLPVIMAEGDEHWLGNLLPWNILLDILSKPEYSGVANSFINDERTEAMFMLRMKESGRSQDRVKIVNDLKNIPPQHNFQITAVGGTYYLQGELAQSVSQSMILGVVTLIILFSIVGFIVSGSFIVALTVAICAALVSSLLMGGLGLLGVPIDIISSPAINVCLGLIVDSMIHITTAAKRALKNTKEATMRSWKVWEKALHSQSWPAMISTFTFIIGFSVFGLSDFPPSQRFGLEIVAGAACALVIALGVFPFLATRLKSRK